jgi:hypothetical protein
LLARHWELASDYSIDVKLIFVYMLFRPENQEIIGIVNDQNM